MVHFDPFCFCLFWWKISRYFKAVGSFWQSKNTISFLYTIPNCTEEQHYIILLWFTILGNYSFHFSKQTSTLAVEFNSDLKISGGGLEPPCLSPPATGHSHLHRLFFLFLLIYTKASLTRHWIDWEFKFLFYIVLLVMLIGIPHLDL